MTQREIPLTSTSTTGNSGPPATVSIHGLHKSFRRTGGELVRAIDDVSLDVHPGELLVLLGPSGCGKTTLLRCIAGLEEPESGEISIAGRPVVSRGAAPVPPEARNIGMMFQSYALWPHMTVAQNVAYPLGARKRPKKEIKDRVARILSIIGIDNLARQHPAQLSGGQQQRVALARSLVAEPTVMLFDEPLSNVDAKVREQLRIEIVDMQRELGFAGIYVTHDQEEAMQLADRMAVMEAGKVAQIDTPREVYHNPVSQYVARFVGALNEFAAERAVDSEDGLAAFRIPGVGDVSVSSSQVPPEVRAGAKVTLGVRPEDIRIARLDPALPLDGSRLAEGVVEREIFSGSYTEYRVRLASGEAIRCWSYARQDALAEGEKVTIEIPPGASRVLARGIAQSLAGASSPGPASVEEAL